MSWVVRVLNWLLPVVIPVVFWLGYRMGYRHGDLHGWAERSIHADRDEIARRRRSRVRDFAFTTTTRDRA